MKTSVIRLLSLTLAVIPMIATAQNNIKSAFEAIIKCPEAQISENHTLDKDPSTGTKTGQSDVYRFILPAGKANLLEKAISAFDKDAEMAYSINRGKTVGNENDVTLIIGNGESGGVHITDPECEYIYSLFLAPLSEDANGIYRYAYGMNFKEDGGKLVGKLVITYATTLKYRQQEAMERQYYVLRNFSNGTNETPSSISSSQQSWFEIIMSYLQSMTSANTQTRIALASKVYKTIKDVSQYPDATATDQDAIREILKRMISDKKYSESVLNSLLNQCLASIK